MEVSPKPSPKDLPDFSFCHVRELNSQRLKIALEVAHIILALSCLYQSQLHLK
jgi:hypothetical protein